MTINEMPVKDPVFAAFLVLILVLIPSLAVAALCRLFNPRNRQIWYQDSDYVNPGL